MITEVTELHWHLEPGRHSSPCQSGGRRLTDIWLKLAVPFALKVLMMPASAAFSRQWFQGAATLLVHVVVYI